MYGKVINIVVFLLVSKNVHVHLAKESGNPHSGLPGNPLASTSLQLCSAQNTAKSQSSNKEQKLHTIATSDLILCSFFLRENYSTALNGHWKLSEEYSA